MSRLDEPRVLRVLAIATIVMVLLRLRVAEVIGFGESEALYASYAMFPQAIYVDHPGLVGVLARALGGDAIPSPATLHRFTAVASTLVPWVAALAARALGASWRGAAVGALGLALVPEVAVGLFGFTPDLPLALLWYASLACAAVALRAEATSLRALAGTLGAALFAALAVASKASGVLLAAGLLATWLHPRERARFRTLAPWAGLAVAATIAWPLVREEVGGGFPMLRHRFVDTQHGAGPSLRNLGAVVGGQLAYVGPFALLASAALAKDLWRRRRDDAGSRLLATTSLASLALLPLALVSRVAEPHWLAPIYLALPLHLAVRDEAEPALVSARLARATLAWGAAVFALALVVVVTPAMPRLLGSRYEPRYDLVNDLYAWPTGLGLVRDQLAQHAGDAEPAPFVVGPHWTVCAQLRAGLPREVQVGCDGDDVADFEHWLPRSTWSLAPAIYFVTDDRFDVDPARAFPDRFAESVSRVGVRRGGVLVRTLRVRRLVKGGHADAAP